MDRAAKLRFPREAGIFLFAIMPRLTVVTTQPPIQWENFPSDEAART
jgi:hypothetical protein